MSAQRENDIPADRLELYDRLVATNPKVERKGAANPYTSLNGHMFSYLNPTGSLALRLPADERETFLKKYKTNLFEAYGAVIKEYVTVPDGLLKKHERAAEVLCSKLSVRRDLKTKTYQEEELKKLVGPVGLEPTTNGL